MHGNILIKPTTVTHCQIHITMTTFQGHGFRDHGHRQYFPKMYFRKEIYRSMVRCRRLSSFLNIILDHIDLIAKNIHAAVTIAVSRTARTKLRRKQKGRRNSYIAARIWESSAYDALFPRFRGFVFYCFFLQKCR